MLRHIPGLASLKAFDASARHLNFTRAAAELNVTPAAVSHQIKELEEAVGVPLFQRTSRHMQLTRQGMILKPAIGEALEGLTRALQRIRQLENPTQVRVTASPSIAAKWLVPRLDRFLETAPGADVRIDVSSEPLDFEREDIDVAIRFGDGNYPGLMVEKLFHDTLFPVCAPELLKGAKPLREPKDLLQFTLIHLEWEAQGAVWPNWRMWMLAAGVKDFNDTRGLHFSQTSLALQAAIDGHGVALGDSTLVGDDLAAGRLIKPFELALRSPAQFAYHLITRRDTAERPMTKAFRNWIIAEAAASQG
ncbi:transcriptional regulator GcvA [Aestuariivirga sp.]|jgi:LysR family glycine cleavage system transcriptional activator|uniref:transcriptional regulator GcvA n=1 Tax=Aestuariivirga sp. TaxID=2650926 RepID=UPI003783EDEF